MELGKSQEDYLEAMLMMKEKNGYIRSIDVAEQLGVTKPSVSYATKHLKAEGYITMNRDGMITITEEGMKIAESIYGRHKMLTSFFIRIGVNPEQARIDACEVEHDLSEETYQALCRYAEKTLDEETQEVVIPDRNPSEKA